jgi:hypothetical protein
MEDQSSDDIELGVCGGNLTLSRATAEDTSSSTKNATTPAEGLFSLPPESVPNCCAICLESYTPGEVVAWSSSCKHLFHQACISDYLAKKLIGGETPCPSCRQKFCDLPETLLVKPAPPTPPPGGVGRPANNATAYMTGVGPLSAWR